MGVIRAGSSWIKRSQPGLLAGPESSALGIAEQKAEKNAAFDLLDALTKSGSLHAVLAATHCFDQSIMDTLVHESRNPLDHVLLSSLIMAATVHEKPTDAIVRESDLERLGT